MEACYILLRRRHAPVGTDRRY